MSYYDGPLYKIVSTCKGGGYAYCRTIPQHPRRNSKGLYPLHRVLAENMVGRSLGTDEVVHHKDGDGSNDDPGNLEVQDRAEHSRQHVTVPSVDCECASCGTVFKLKPGQKRARERRNITGKLFCSRSCGGKGAS